MTKSDQVLIVDDLEDWRKTLSGLLVEEGYKVRSVASKDEALEALKTGHFSVAVLDARLDESDEDNREGLTLMHEIRKRYPSTAVIILTGYADVEMVREALEPRDDKASPAFGFLEKTEIDKLPEYVKRASFRKQSPSFETSYECKITVSLEPGQRPFVQGRGNLRFTSTSKKPLDMDPERFARWGSERLMGKADRRFLTKEVGQELYRLLFAQHTPVLNGYHRALGRVSKSQHLHLVLESTRDLAGLPLEFLFSEEAGDYLALLHPIIRKIRGVVTRRAPISPAFIEQVISSGDKIRVLLVASNTKPPIDLIDEMSEQIAKLLAPVDWIELTHLRTKMATYPAIRKRLQSCKYHIVHYVGHGLFLEDSPEQSCLIFWEDETQSEIKPITGSQLRLLLQDSDTHLFHLTCCEGAKAGDLTDLLDDDYLGIADGIIQAGVPSVLGYRWPVPAVSAKEMALTFYRSMLRYGSPEMAVMEARKELAMRNKDDLTWASPIMIVQTD
jgi:CheY-like chemotaxis protein